MTITQVRTRDCASTDRLVSREGNGRCHRRGTHHSCFRASVSFFFSSSSSFSSSSCAAAAAALLSSFTYVSCLPFSFPVSLFLPPFFSLSPLQCIPAACPLPSPVAAYSGSIRRVVSWRTARAVPVVFYVRIIFSTRSHARQCDRHRRVLTDARDKFSNSFGRSRASDTRLFADASGMRRAARQSVILFFWRATSATSVYFMHLRSMCVHAVVFLLTFNVVISLMSRIDFLRISYGRCLGRYDF